MLMSATPPAARRTVAASVRAGSDLAAAGDVLTVENTRGGARGRPIQTGSEWTNP